MQTPPFFKKIAENPKIVFAIVLAIIIAAPASKKIYNLAQVFYKKTVPLEKIPQEIVGSIVTLKNNRPEYFIDLHNMFSRTVRQGLEFPDTITLAYSIEYFQHQLHRQKNGELIVYAIFDNKDNKPIGVINIRDLNDNDPGQMGCWINEAYWGSGRIQEAIKLCSDVYFRLKNVPSYNAHVRLWNKRSYYALKKAGFVETGFFYENGVPTRYVLEYYNKH